MSPRAVSDPWCARARSEERDRIEVAVRRLLASGLPALPVADRGGHLCGIFGEREFFGALFPGYLAELGEGMTVQRTRVDAP